MAVKVLGSATKLCGLLVVVICCAAGQENNEVDVHSSDRQLEDSIATDMLNLVDKKFQTLTTRIASMESAVSSLQYYSIRHIREIRGRLQSTDNDLETVRKQVTQLGDEQRAHNVIVNIMAADVSEVKKSSTDLLGEFESSVFYINENLDKQNKALKTLLEDTVVRTSREMTAQISKQMEETVRQMEHSKREPASCSVDFSGISEHIDLRFAEFKMQTHAYFVRLINAANLDVRSGNRFTNGENDKEETKKEEEKSCDCKGELQKDSSVRVHAEDTVGRTANTSQSGSENISKAENVTAPPAPDVHRKYQDENDEQVMNALYNMTSSVLQAVSYFRNTGRLLEQILSNTDSMLTQQTDITRRFDPTYLGGQISTEDEESYDSNIIPDGHGAEKQVPRKTLLSGVKAAERGCFLQTDVFSNVTAIIKNGSQLLEVLTDLAQLSSVSLSRVSAALQDEVTRVEGIRTQMATAMLARTTGGESDPVTRLTNVTQQTLKLVEAVATNTGWLPQIHHNVQILESMTNRSLYGVLQNHELLRRAQQSVANQEDSIASFSREHNKATRQGISRTQSQGDRPLQGDLNESTKDEATLNRESLETIYSTSLQLNRIMPALTKLLSEPDPLITLVGGGRPDQGRMEIYHNGLWGALCHRDLSHVEADLICRHLGFRGGISAGPGHFGPGGGTTWIFNASCLASPQCAVVTNSDETRHCSHELDAGVICDHMLRIISADGSTKEKVGRLEIHHRGVWLPICGDGWSGYSARVACQQMGFSDGREMQTGDWHGQEANSTWLSNVSCTGRETRLDVCQTNGWSDTCPGLTPAGVRCV